jgi:hypothetical protein
MTRSRLNPSQSHTGEIIEALGLAVIEYHLPFRLVQEHSQ